MKYHSSSKELQKWEPDFFKSLNKTIKLSTQQLYSQMLSVIAEHLY